MRGEFVKSGHDPWHETYVLYKMILSQILIANRSLEERVVEGSLFD